MLGLALSSTSAALLRPGEDIAPVPTDPITIFAANPALNLDDTNTGTTFWVVVTLNSEEPLDELRITIAPASTNALTVLGVSFAKFVAEGTTLGALTEATFSEAGGFASATTEQTSDWIDIAALGLSAGDKLAIGFTTGGSGQASTRYNNFAYVADTYFKAGTSWDDPATTLGTGHTKLAGYNYAIAKVEARGLSGGGGTPPAENTIPMSFNDAMFSAMTEYANNISLSSGADLSRMSIVNQSGTQSITCGGDNEVLYCRVDSREAVRLTSTAVVNKCYLEATGLAEEDDHADTIQVYSPGQTGGDLTIQNSHLVAHLTAATANFFCADNWAGSIAFQDVILQGGPYGMRIDADNAHVDISLNKVYFVGPFGTATHLIQDVGIGTHKVLNWTDVYEATIENGQLVVGNAISAPAFTPRQLDPALWLEPARGGLFQSNAGTTAASADNDVVGYVTDLSGNARHFTSIADDTTRPTLQGVGTRPCLRFDGVDDLLRRAESLGLFEAGAYTLSIAFKGNSPAADSRLFAGGNTATNNTIFSSIQADATTPTSSCSMYRNDAGSQQVSPANTRNANVFDGNNKVLTLVDDGTFIRTYVNGVAGASTGWTKSGAYTINRSSIGALLRAAASNWWAGDIYGVVAVARAVTESERDALKVYMGNLAGLSL